MYHSVYTKSKCKKIFHILNQWRSVDKNASKNDLQWNSTSILFSLHLIVNIKSFKRIIKYNSIVLIKKKKKLTNSVRIHFILTKFDKIFTITKYENPVSLPRERNETWYTSKVFTRKIQERIPRF